MSSNKEDLRVIPKANYAKISTIFIVTIIIVIVASVSYKMHADYVDNIPVIRGTISEIENKDLENYVMEHSDFLLYIGVAKDENCKELEKDLKDLLKRRNLLDTVYLNISSVNNKIEFYNVFNANYSNNIKLNSYPAFLIFSDGKVVDLVQRKDNKLNVGDIERLLDEYEIKGEVK